jgi:hypothetical protein
VPAHLSSTLASIGPALPYGLAAKLARPDRPISPLDMGSAWSAALSADLLAEKIAPMFAGLSAEEGAAARRAERNLRRERERGYAGPPADT